MGVSDQLDSIIDKTSRLMELCQALQEENELLKLENDQQQQTLVGYQQRIKEQDEKLRALTLARKLEGITPADWGLSEKNIDIKQKINEFVREIDRCIVLLKK